MANGGKCGCLGTVTLLISLIDKCFLVRVILPTLPHCLILGIAFWSKMGSVPDLRQSIWHFSPIDIVSVGGNFSDFEWPSQRTERNKEKK